MTQHSCEQFGGDIQMKIRTYSELKKFNTIEERFEYLKLNGEVGVATFGYDRIFNQNFYASKIWKDARRKVIIRDGGCDLGIPGYEVNDHITIHHMNPVTKEDIVKENWEYLTDPEFLISASYNTHKAIHFGDQSLLPKLPVERSPGDTCLWR